MKRRVPSQRRVPPRAPIPYISPGPTKHIDDLVQSSSQVRRTLPADGSLERNQNVRILANAPRRRATVSLASPAQREKKATGCRLHGLACGPTDAAHIVDRSLGGCDDAACTIPLCRTAHEAYDAHELDILPLLTYDEQAHAVGHLGILRALERITGSEWLERLSRGARY